MFIRIKEINITISHEIHICTLLLLRTHYFIQFSDSSIYIPAGRMKDNRIYYVV